jgi:uncharacterized protein YfiM (DUF2279 family)
LKKTAIIITFILSCHPTISFCQQSIFSYSDTLNKKRLYSVIASESITTIGSFVVLNEVWYKPYPRSKFHTFNDNAEWLQMDKVGHFMTANYLSQLGIETFKWAGVSQKKSAWIGGSIGLIYLTGLELLDGTSQEWGFSWGDMAANALGYVSASTQTHLWNEQRIKIKFSAHLSEYAQYRPNVLGKSTAERLLKDYNGQTYWMSFNIKSLFLKETSLFPSWLNLAVGYGAEGMISGTPDAEFCQNNPLCDEFDRYRQYYLSFDIDLAKLPIKKQWIRTALGPFGFIKIPSPTLELSKNGARMWWLYF